MKISWHLPASNQITLKVYDILGNEVSLIDDYREAGRDEVEFDGSSLSDGVVCTYLN
jgi:hypothetical protein